MKSSRLKKLRIIPGLALLMLIGMGFQSTLLATENLLPRPASVEHLKGGFIFTAKTTILYNSKGNPPVEFAVARLVDLLDQKFQLRPKSSSLPAISNFQVFISGKNKIPPDLPKPSSGLESLGEEAYELIVQEKGIRITANTDRGLLWALMTLTQLIQEDPEGKFLVPGIKILDWPHYRWRGYMLDTGRSPFSVAQIKRTIRICSVFKLNLLMLREGDDELNAVKYNHLPLGQKNPFALTIEELKDIIDYGAKHGIVVFPEIESLGHAAAKRLHYPDLIEGDLLTEYWPGFSHLRKANFKVGDPRTYKLLEAIYDELFPLLKYPLVHLGLDEVRLPRQKQAEHLARLLPIVDRVGRKYGHEMQIIVWSDAPPTPPEYQARVIRCLWIYENTVKLDNQYARSQGITALIQPDCPQKVIMAGGSGTLHQPYSKGDYQGAFNNLASWARLGEQHQNFIGLLAVQWASNVIDEWFPNFLMAADFGWNVPPQMPDYNRNMQRITFNLQKLKDFSDPDPAAVARPAWDGIWLNGRYWDEDIMTGQQAAPVVEIYPPGKFFHQKSAPIEIRSNFPNANIFYTLDGSQPTRQSNFYFEPFQVSSTTTVKARACLPGRPPGYVISAVFGSLDFQDPPTHGRLKPGLDYNYFQTFTYTVANLRNREITRSGIISRFQIAPCATGENEFGFIFKGWIDIKQQGVYTFYLLSNDGSKLYLNQKELIDNGGRHGAQEKSGRIALRVGRYPIAVEYFQNGGGQALRLSWEGPGFNKHEIPPAVLFHDHAKKAALNGRNRIKDLINQAGNADDDETRLDFLTKLSKLPNLERRLKADTDRLITEIKRWLSDKSLSYFGVSILAKEDYDFGIEKTSPLYPITTIYRARMLLWVTLEYGGHWKEANARRKRFDLVRGLFEEVSQAFPENRLIRMYLGEPIAPRKLYASVPGAPEWAVAQREGIERLADIIEWWIDHRQQENGAYGGDWDDDCEMWRWWVPVLIAFDSPKITAAQAIFSRSLLARKNMKLGFTKHVYDVQHTAEPSADALTPMMHIDPDNKEWSRRALRLAELMESFWTGLNERGYLQFKSTYFGADSISPDLKKACDTVYHPRTVQPTLLYWQRTGDEQLGKLFTAWMDTWVDAAACAERGKPAGIIPSAIHWPDGAIGGLGEKWWKPENHHSRSSLYVWPSAMSMLLNTLLLTNQVTQNPKYLEPIQSMAAVRADYLQHPPQQPPVPGSKAWCGSKACGISAVIAKYLLLGGTTNFSHLLEIDENPYLKYRFQGERQPLETALQNNAAALRVNFAGYTREVRYTDRVLRFPTIFLTNGIYPSPVQTIPRPNTNLLYSTLTGDPGNAGYFPLNAVRWLTLPRDLAALVTETGRDRFRAELFHFGDEPRQMSALFYLLDSGKYIFDLYPAGTSSRPGKTGRIVTVSKTKPRVAFQLPAQTLCVLEISRAD